ncbi:LOW QUALITY PROTEIN: putative F-box protein At5g60060, partial [Prosopis cineraria]|uniref:LOW QUALITY PROTEIN: putative F-box protein At5g60060 n=1 Tax=Prosopis cineraria TaxID=364024 RepID=UPI00240F46B5
MDPHSTSWSGLRSDLLLNIANRLDSRIDRLCFRAVCYSWRSVLPTPSRRSASPSPPLKLPFPMGSNPHRNRRRRGYFNLVESTVYCFNPSRKISDTWKTSKCWLIRIEETKEPGKVRLMDPLSRLESENLSPRLPRGLNLLDYRASEITKVYDLRFVGNSKIPELDFPEVLSVHVMKVAVCSEGAGFAVMAIDTAGQLSIGRKGDKKWNRISNGREGAFYNDVVYHNAKFYAVDDSGLTISVDLSLKITLVTPAMTRPGYNRHNSLAKRLVSSLGDLFLLDRDFDPENEFLAGFNSDSDEDVLPTYFHVYKLNREKRKWVSVKSLGNRVMFVGDHCTFSVSAQEYRGCKKNCIYYNERGSFCGDLVEYHPGGDAALFDMDDCSAKMLSGVFSYSG